MFMLSFGGQGSYLLLEQSVGRRLVSHALASPLSDLPCLSCLSAFPCTRTPAAAGNGIHLRAAVSVDGQDRRRRRECLWMGEAVARRGTSKIGRNSISLSIAAASLALQASLKCSPNVHHRCWQHWQCHFAVVVELQEQLS